MDISFKKIKGHMRVKNPFKGFSMDEIPFEIRYDPLTGQSTRIFDLPYRPVPRPDFDAFIKKSKEMTCPFCPESLESMTPLFPEDMIPGGRLHDGAACLFPNLLPLDRYAGVCIFRKRPLYRAGRFYIGHH